MFTNIDSDVGPHTCIRTANNNYDIPIGTAIHNILEMTVTVRDHLAGATSVLYSVNASQFITNALMRSPLMVAYVS